MQTAIGLAFLVVCFIWNTFAPRFAGVFQNVATIIKLIPLLLIAVFGLIFGDPIAGFSQHATQATGASLAWVAAIGPIASSYDGWSVSTTIAPELKNAKKTLPIALMIAPIIILFVYVGYFVGVATYLEPSTVMAMGDGHVFYLANELFGAGFARVVAVSVVVAVMGTVNGLTLSYIRIPYALALSGDIPLSRFIGKLGVRSGMPVASAIAAFVLALVWAVFHLVTQLGGLLPNSDISEITIATSYLLYIVLYVKVFQMWRVREIKSVFKGCIAPIMATAGSLFICIGSMQNPTFWLCLIASLAICVAGVVYDIRKTKRSV